MPVVPMIFASAFCQVAVLGAPWEDLLDVLGKSQVVEVNLEHAILRARDRPLRWVFPEPQLPWQHQPPYPIPPPQDARSSPENSPLKGRATATAAAADVPSSPAVAPTATAVNVQPTAKNSRGGRGSTKNDENGTATPISGTQTRNRSSDNGKRVQAHAAGKDAALKATGANVHDDAATDGEGNGSDGDSSYGAVGFTCALQGAREEVPFI